MRTKLISTVIVIAAAVIAASTAPARDVHDRKHREGEQQHKHGHAASPLIEEMVKLDAVFRDVVSAVAMDDGHRAHEALETMHGTMEKTHAGVKHGTVTLRKNAGHMKEFVEQDRQFHAKLEDLAKTSHRNDGNAMLALTKELLDRCVRCHRDFRP